MWFFPSPYWRKGWVYFIWDGRLKEGRERRRGGYDTVHLTFTHIHNTWYMASQRILLNLYCSWGQALNSPLKEHNGSSDRAHGISVYRAGLRLFHPVQDVTSCRRFFSCRNAAGQSYLGPCDWLMNLLDGNRPMQATPPHTTSIRDSAGSLSRMRSVGFQSNSHIRTEEIPNLTRAWKLKTSSSSKKQIPNGGFSVHP